MFLTQLPTHPPMITLNVVIINSAYLDIGKVLVSLQRNVKELLSKPTDNVNLMFYIVSLV